MSATISLEELSAYLDGELPPERSAEVAAALRADPVLAAREAAFRQDRDRLAAAFAPVAQAPLPQPWLDRIDAAMVAPPSARRPSFVQAWAIAACIALVLGTALLWRHMAPAPDAILADAEAARTGRLAALASLEGESLPPDDAQRALLQRATGLPVRAPDLRRLGWQLAALRTFKGAAELRYSGEDGKILTVYVRKSLGGPRSDLLRKGDMRICIDQDDTVGAVIMGDISAGQMLRAAGLAYADLDL